MAMISCGIERTATSVILVHIFRFSCSLPPDVALPEPFPPPAKCRVLSIHASQVVVGAVGGGWGVLDITRGGGGRLSPCWFVL